MAWDEWERLKAEAEARQGNGMRLDGASGPPGGGDVASLKTNAAGNGRAVAALRDSIRPATDVVGSHSKDPSDEAVREFSGWCTATGLSEAQMEWNAQLKNLVARLEVDQEALQKRKSDFQYVDFDVSDRIAQLDPGHGQREI